VHRDDRGTETEDAPPREGQALVRVKYLSVDPTIRTWMKMCPATSPDRIGEVVRSAGIGEVVESNSARYTVGDLVFGTTGAGLRTGGEGPRP